MAKVRASARAWRRCGRGWRGAGGRRRRCGRAGAGVGVSAGAGAGGGLPGREPFFFISSTAAKDSDSVPPPHPASVNVPTDAVAAERKRRRVIGVHRACSSFLLVISVSSSISPTRLMCSSAGGVRTAGKDCAWRCQE